MSCIQSVEDIEAVWLELSNHAKGDRTMAPTRFLFILVLALTAAGCAGSTAQRRREPLPVGTSETKTSYGIAGWYGQDFHGKETANGERFDMYAYTAAHRELPFGTRVRVTNLSNGRHVVVRINDRGPFVPGRMIDVSYITARDLGMLETGLAEVRLEIVGDNSSEERGTR